MRRMMFFAGGILCGVLIGAAVGLLLTPSSGDTVRSDAQNRLESAKSEARLASEQRRRELEAQLAAYTSTPSTSKAVRRS